MLSTTGQQQAFSDDLIRRFLLGRLHGPDQSAFEKELFQDSELEQRTRLAEIALADDFAMGRMSTSEQTAFLETFPFSAARQRQIEVSTALRECFAPVSQERLVTFNRPVWKWAFATMILIMLFATIWVATKEPRIAGRFVPPRTRPAVAITPTPEVAHHAEHASEPAAHREDSEAPQSHEVATNAIVLDSMTTQENAGTVTLATLHEQHLRVQLIVPEVARSSYVAELMMNTGEVVYREAEIATTAVDTDRVSFDLPIEHLAAGDFQIRLTRTSDGKQAIYFLRLR